MKNKPQTSAGVFVAVMVVSALVAGGCSVFGGSDDERDFGIRTDHVLLSGETEQVLFRNRNMINAKFSSEADEQPIRQLLETYNLVSQLPLNERTGESFASYLTVRDQPAEAYYTRYGLSDSDSGTGELSGIFANEPLVKYALPIYELPDGGKKSLHNAILFSFE